MSEIDFAADGHYICFEACVVADPFARSDSKFMYSFCFVLFTPTLSAGRESAIQRSDPELPQPPVQRTQLIGTVELKYLLRDNDVMMTSSHNLQYRGQLIGTAELKLLVVRE